MNEEEFLKEHPSFIGRMTFRDGKEMYGLYTRDFIHETQLDKQKVKESIKKVLLHYVDKGANIMGGMKLMEKLFEELGIQ